MKAFRSIVFLVLVLLVPSFADEGEKNNCNRRTKDLRAIEVALACEVEVDTITNAETCPSDCLPKLRDFTKDCNATMDDLALQAIAASDQDACFDGVLNYFLDKRGDDCAKNRMAFTFLHPVLCAQRSCSPECSDLVEGICNHCGNGALEPQEARAVETDLFISSSHCTRSQCILMGGDNSDTTVEEESPKPDGTSIGDAISGSGGDNDSDDSSHESTAGGVQDELATTESAEEQYAAVSTGERKRAAIGISVSVLSSLAILFLQSLD